LADKQAQIKVTQNKLPDSQVALEIEISQDRARQAYNQAVDKMMRSANIPGFRKGKVPRKVVLQQFGAKNLKAGVLETLIQQTFEAAVEQEGLTVLGNVQLDPPFESLISQIEPGEAFTFTVSADVPPDVQLKRYQDLEITPKAVEVDPDHVDQVLESHRAKQATLIPVEDRAAQRGDVVLIDYRLVAQPKAEDQDAAPESEVASNTQEAKDFQLDLSENTFLPELVEGVIGMNIGETQEIPVMLPEQLVVAEVDRSVVFTVTLNEIKLKELPDLDDDFAAEISEFSTLAELRQFLETQHRQEVNVQANDNVTSAILTALLAELEVELPSTLIQEQVNRLINEKAAQWQAQGADINELFAKEKLPQIREQLKPEAVTRLKCSLALAEIADRESIQVSPDAVQRRLQEVLQQVGGKVEDRERFKAVLEEELLHQQVLQWLQEHSQVNWVGSTDVADQPVSSAENLTEPSELPNTESEASHPVVSPVTAEESEPEPELQEQEADEEE
jgi:trigger factor